MQIYKDQIYSFKLSSGEELLAEVTSVDVDTLDIVNPLTITLTAQGPDTLPGMIAGDYSKAMELNTTNICLIAEVEEHIKVSYRKAIVEMKKDIAKRREEKQNASSE